MGSFGSKRVGSSGQARGRESYMRPDRHFWGKHDFNNVPTVDRDPLASCLTPVLPRRGVARLARLQ